MKMIFILTFCIFDFNVLIKDSFLICYTYLTIILIGKEVFISFFFLFYFLFSSFFSLFLFCICLFSFLLFIFLLPFQSLLFLHLPFSLKFIIWCYRIVLLPFTSTHFISFSHLLLHTNFSPLFFIFFILILSSSLILFSTLFLFFSLLHLFNCISCRFFTVLRRSDHW